MKWNGAISLEIVPMPGELHTEIINMRNQGDEFHKLEVNK